MDVDTIIQARCYLVNGNIAVSKVLAARLSLTLIPLVDVSSPAHSSGPAGSGETPCQSQADLCVTSNLPRPVGTSRSRRNSEPK